MILLFIPLAIGIWVAIDASKRGMNAPLWGLLTFLILIIGLPLYLSERRKNPIKQNFQNQSTSASNQNTIHSNQNISTPSICPQCKNPNTNRSNICEWCGNQIA